MSDESTGFGPSEGDVGAPTATYQRTPLKVLQSLESKPLQQAIKAIEYIEAGKERTRKLLRACSPKALALIAENGPEYVEVVASAAE